MIEQPKTKKAAPKTAAKPKMTIKSMAKKEIPSLKQKEIPSPKQKMAVAMAKQKEITVGTGSQKRAAKREIKTYEKQQAAKASGNTKKAGKLYDKLVKRQTKSAMKGVDVNYGNKKVTYSAPIK